MYHNIEILRVNNFLFTLPRDEQSVRLPARFSKAKYYPQGWRFRLKQRLTLHIEPSRNFAVEMKKLLSKFVMVHSDATKNKVTSGRLPRLPPPRRQGRARSAEIQATTGMPSGCRHRRMPDPKPFVWMPEERTAPSNCQEVVTLMGAHKPRSRGERERGCKF